MEPLARTTGLVRTELPGELLVYDLERHRAHCLNATAALVFQHCDGRTSVAQIARIVRRELDVAADEGLVWASLKQLGAKHLLEQRVVPPASAARWSRRELARRVGLAVVPLITTVLAPTPAEAVATGCVGPGGCGAAADGTPCWCVDANLECPSNACFGGNCSAGC